MDRRPCKSAVLRGARLSAACAALAVACGCRTWWFGRDDAIPPPSNTDFYEGGTFGADSVNSGGKFLPAKAAEAYREMLVRFGAPAPDGAIPESSDFRQGDFAHFGEGVLRWANEIREEYAARDILLLPGQATVECRHERCNVRAVDTAGGREYKKDIPCKTASWLVRSGSVYAVFSDGTPNLEDYPEVKARTGGRGWKAARVEKWTADGKAHKLPADETWYFFMAGPEGAVVSEVSNYHDESGVRWAVPGAAF